MKNFKKYIVEILKQENDSSLSEINDDNHLKHILGDNDNHGINKIHYHSDIIPKNLSITNKIALNSYTSNLGSNVINPFLHRLADNKLTDDDKNNLNHHLTEIKKIKNSFTSENTNRKPIITYSGVPTRIGRDFLKADSNSKHTLPRFTSTSTTDHVGKNFAHHLNKDNTNELHVLKCYNEPGAALSIAHVSDMPPENEMLLPHGAHITYHHSTEGKAQKDGRNYRLYTHHVTIHNTRTPLEQYPGYKSNVKKNNEEF